MSTQPSTQSTATLAARKLVAFESPSEARGKKQVQGLQVFAAAAIALVEVRNAHRLSAMLAHLANYGVEFGNTLTLVEQTAPAGPQRPMHIAALYKKGVEVNNATLLAGSDLGNPNLRRNLVCNVNIAKLGSKLTAVHLKSGRGRESQDIRDQQCQRIGE